MGVEFADLLASPIPSGGHDGEVVTGPLVQAEAVQQAVGQGQVLPQPARAKWWKQRKDQDEGAGHEVKKQKAKTRRNRVSWRRKRRIQY